MRALLSCSCVALAVACAPMDSDGGAGGRHTGTLTAEELDARTLEMLNHPTTTLKMLDVDAELTSTAAKHLIEHRDGPDGEPETADDDLFGSIQEVDDVYGVGPAALDQLRAFAETWAPLEPGEEPPIDELTEKVLTLMNHPSTTLTVLDVDVALTSTAAKHLVAHRDGPDGAFGTTDDDLFDTLAEISGVKYVGEAAMEQIKTYAQTWDPDEATGPDDVPKMLQFLNDLATTRKLLEEEVGLNSTQSQNVVSHRDGPDETPGTEDDDPFDTVQELDGIKYIGPVTIENIAAYAETWEPVDPAKVLEQKVLDFLNHASTNLEVLDIDVGLNALAADALMEHKAGADGVAGTEDDGVFESLQQVDDVKYVGSAALDQIKAYAETWDPDAEPEPEVVPEPELSCATCAEFVGSPLEFDAGPPPGSGWAELFASVPNYRQVARELGEQWLAPNPVTGMSRYDEVNAQRAADGLDPIALYTLTKEKFRYHMGPLFYRGRLDGTARVLVLGQEGATDEALVHRAFIGGTGQKVQNFLNAIGITQSYILVNTFVYSIYEQYDEFTDELAQQGPIREHRDEILLKIFEENDIELVLTFGNAAYQSMANFRDTHFGGEWPNGSIRWSHMLHPGAAAMAYAPDSSGEIVDEGTLSAVVESFASSWSRIWYWRYVDPGWLPSDPDGWSFQGSSFFFGDRDIPWRDMPYGASVQIGRGGTKSERARSGLQVQLRSQHGVRYEAPDAAYPSTPSKANSGFVKDLPEEVSWEPPRLNPDTRHDPGPSPEWAAHFAGTPAQSVVEEETGLDTNNDFHQTPLWYRGDLNGDPWLLIIAQDYGSDQIIAGRTLVGDAGQKIQHLLENVGAGGETLVINPYPYPLNDTVADYDMLNLAQSLSLSAYREQLLTKLLAEKPITMVLTFGEVADAAFQPVADQFDGEWLSLAHPREASAAVSWNHALTLLQSLAAEYGLTGAFAPYTLSGFANVRSMIPREHLRWGLPMWFGTSGDLSQQPDRSWVFWNAPKWVKSEDPLD